MISKIAGYTVEAELGRGGFARVYRAFDPDMRRPVAIKVLSQSDAEVVRRFELEVDTTAQLQHPNIVVLYQRGEDNGAPYVVMELLEGMTLEQVIREKAPRSILSTVRIMNQVADGLAYAHSRGVIHRDIKPANIMLRPDGSVKIMDFGIARVAGRGLTQRTRPGMVIGTVPYMAPEQITSSRSADQQTDIFAFGDVYYEMLTGVHPFAIEHDVYATISRIQGIEPEPLRSVRPDCPEALEQIVFRALAKDRLDRYPQMSELLLDNEALIGDLRREGAAEILAEVRKKIDAGDLETAEVRLREAAEMDPGNRDIRQLRVAVREEATRRAASQRLSELLQRSEQFMSERRFEEAVAVLEGAVRLDDGAGAQEALGRAREALRANLEADRLVEEARRNQERGRAEEALARARDALQLAPEHPGARALLQQLQPEVEYAAGFQALLTSARESIRGRRYAEAVQAIEAAPRYIGEGEVRSLLATARAARTLDDEDRAVTAALVRVGELERQESPQAALEALQPALAAYPKNRVLSQVAERLAAALAAPPAPPPAPLVAPSPPPVLAPPIAVRQRARWTTLHTVAMLSVVAAIAAAAWFFLNRGQTNAVPPARSQGKAISTPAAALPPAAAKIEPTPPRPSSRPSPSPTPTPTATPVAQRPLSVSPTELRFEYTVGQPPPGTQSIEIHAPGFWTFTAGENWLTARERVIGGRSWLDVTIRPDGVRPGEHTGILSVASAGQERLVSVHLNIGAPPAPTAAAVTKPPPAPRQPAEPPVDCHAPEYTNRGLPDGSIIWSGDQPLAPGAVLTIGRRQTIVDGPRGTLRGTALPGCDVTVTVQTPGVIAESVAAGQMVRIRNTSSAPLMSVRLRWSVR